MPDLEQIQGVEIFAVGEWNGDKYTEKDLDTMVEAFEETNETLTPPLKFGHDNNQTILQQDGLPAAGWVSNLRRVGKKLVADIIDIPSRVFEVIKNRAYDTVSAEIFWNAKVDGKSYKRFLSAVALLGADIPAVTSLGRISDRFSLVGDIHRYDLKQQSFSIKLDDILKQNTNKGTSMAIEEKDEMTKKLEEEQGKVEALNAQVTALKAECADLKKSMEKKNAEEVPPQEEEKKIEEKKDNAKKDVEIKKLTSTIDSLHTELKTVELDKAIDAMMSEQLVTKSMRPYITQLLGEDKKTYTIQVEKDEKEFSKDSLLKEILKLHKASTVNLDENSEAGKASKDDKDMEAKINTYAKEKKVSYSAAYKAVMKS